MPIFGSLAWSQEHQAHNNTWRTLMAPDWSFGGLSHLWYQIWHHESTKFVIPVLYSNFHLHNVIICASTTLLYLEDIDGSWLEFMEDWIFFDIKFDIMNQQNFVIPDLYSYFQPPSMIISASRNNQHDSVIDALLIVSGSWKLTYNSGMTYYVDSWCQIWNQRWPNPPQLQ